jgi:hypothetical protein
MTTELKAAFWAFFCGLFVASLLNTLPFADAEKARRAIKECEKSLPRDQQCKVVGVPE